MRRFVSAIALGFILAASGPALAAERDSVTVAAPWEITSVDPSVSGFAFQRMQVAETLVDADATGRLRPGLAGSWEVSEDGLVWRFAIRDGVRFHDGTELTAEAAARAIARAAERPGVLSKAPLAKVRGEENAVVIALSEPFAALPALLTHATTVILAPTAFADDGAAKTAIGTGPFRVETFSPPQSMTLARFEDYWGPKPTLREARYLAAGRAETRALLAESGDADLVFTLDPSGFARLGSAERVKTDAVPIPRVVTLKVNAGHPFLADPRARRALSLAVDRAGIAAGITRFPEAGATQLFPPALGGWHDSDLEPLAHDPEDARRLLAELGWAPGPDGVLAKDGQRFALTLRTFPDRPELPLIAAALQDQWRSIGIELAVSVGSYSEIPAGHQDGSLEIGLYARNYGVSPDPIGTLLADFGKGGGDWGAMGWDNADVAGALAAIARTADPEARMPEIAKVTEALQAELPVIPIVWYQHTVAVAKDLKGAIIDPLERSYGLSGVSWTE